MTGFISEHKVMEESIILAKPHFETGPLSDWRSKKGLYYSAKLRQHIVHICVYIF
jgi:hypothetical protein